MGRVVAVKEKVDKCVVEKNALSMHYLFSVVKLSQLQKAHRFDQSLHETLDDSQKQCSFCLHYSLIWAPENNTLVDKSAVLVDEHNAAI